MKKHVFSNAPVPHCIYCGCDEQDDLIGGVKCVERTERKAKGAQQTPGPWRVGDAGLTVFGPPNGNTSPETVAHLNNRANARLVGAAPELLNALKEYDNIIASLLADKLLAFPRWAGIHIGEAHKLAVAALAKAEGAVR